MKFQADSTGLSINMIKLLEAVAEEPVAPMIAAITHLYPPELIGAHCQMILRSS